MKRAFLAIISIAGTLLPTESRANDYPTEAIADYVLGCMAANGQTAASLRQCSCSIDVVASLMSFEDYTAAETVLRMQQIRGGGERMAIFRETPFAKGAVDKLRRAQMEAEVRCFL